MAPRQLEILQLLADGLALRDIASHVGNTYETTKNSVHAIRVYLGADTNCQAVAMGLRRGLIN